MTSGFSSLAEAIIPAVEGDPDAHRWKRNANFTASARML